eukprot:TRINITY_DN62372_c0_g1_i1.p1 TRINITY_DN62372_c0_g1~~TRINITY_DN62372_c0_g1_i1.p1  ORF type:complete len:524 (-),score=161.36 TRINITY_DN62372_c0_g1_i1:131-1666(-)
MGVGLSVCSQKEEEDDAEGSVDPTPMVEDIKAQRKWVLPAGGKLSVMMFGMTGAGKSALGNLIADDAIFASGDDTASVTNLDSIMKYEAEDGALTLMDTIGLGDTEIDQEKVVSSIRDVALSAPNGVDCLFYVMRNARITDDAIARLIYVTEYLWGSESLLNLYIVVTCAARYLQSRKDAEEWIQRQVEINWRFKHIYSIVGNNPNRFIFIDNPDPASGEPETEERREKSHQAIMKCLCQHPRDAVPPFTQAMMKQVAEMTKKEREELDKKEKEMQRLQAEVKKSKKVLPKKKPRRASQKSQDSNDSPIQKSEADLALESLMAKAKEDYQVAQKAMQKKLNEVKEDKTFQAAVRQQAERATFRFSNDFNKGERPGDNHQEKSQAASRMMSSLSKRLLGNGSKTTSADVKNMSEAPSLEKPTEEVVKELLNKVRKNNSKPQAQLFTDLGGWTGAGAITPMVFTKFLLQHAPGITQVQVGSLWWRADTNSDGQVDSQEWKEFFEKHVEASGND